MADTGTLHKAFIDELRDAYDGGRQLTKALPKLAKTATAPALKEAFTSHLTETEGQIKRLEQVFGLLGEKPRGKHCEGIAGSVEEGAAIMKEDFDDATMDACLIAAGQRAEHYEEEDGEEAVSIGVCEVRCEHGNEWLTSNILNLRSGTFSRGTPSDRANCSCEHPVGSRRRRRVVTPEVTSFGPGFRLIACAPESCPPDPNRNTVASKHRGVA
jgi:hypothetical protein